MTQAMTDLSLPTSVADRTSNPFHDEKCRFTERQLRRIVGLPTAEEQAKAFEKVRKAVEGTKTPTVAGHGDNGDGKRVGLVAR